MKKTLPSTAHPMSHFKSFMLKIDTLDIVCASDYEEFFYKEDDSLVLEGDPVGLDVENEDQVDFILFSNIYWSPTSPNNSLYA